MDKMIVKGWLQSKNLAEEKALGAASEVDQGLSRNGKPVKAQGYSLANFMLTIYQETKKVYLPAQIVESPYSLQRVLLCFCEFSPDH